MKTSMIYKMYNIVKAIWRFIDAWWYVIILGIAIYLLTKTDML